MEIKYVFFLYLLHNYNLLYIKTNKQTNKQTNNKNKQTKQTKKLKKTKKKQNIK